MNDSGTGRSGAPLAERTPTTQRAPMGERSPAELMLLADRILDVVPRAMRRIRSEVRAAGQPALSVAHVRALMYVRRHPGVGLSAVAEHLGLSRAGASMLVDRLVRGGFLDRADDPSERRRIQLSLTGAGAEEVGRAHLAVRDWLAREIGAMANGAIDDLDPALTVLERIAAEPPA